MKQPVPVFNGDVVEKKLKLLIIEWEKDEAYLNGPDDNPIDKAVGQTYGECAKRLKEIIASQHIASRG